LDRNETKPLGKWKFKNNQEPKENFGGDEKSESKITD